MRINFLYVHGIFLTRRKLVKTKKEIQREIYHFVEDLVLETDEPVILQTILNKFCTKYSVSAPTITRYLEGMVGRRNPFKLRTWYDKNRYYTIHTVSYPVIVIIALSVSAVLFSFFSDLFQFIPIKLLERTIILLVGFWLSFAVKHELDKKSNKK